MDLAALRTLLKQLDEVSSFQTAQHLLEEMARVIGMPVLAWAPDVSRPDFDPHMDAFMRRQGWPDEVMALWWDRNVMLKVPLYVRCRVKALPFVSEVRFSQPESAPEARKIETAMLKQGLQSMITVPIHLPRGQVAMITWSGPQPVEKARAILSEVKAELMAAGHYFMGAFAAHVQPADARGEELSRLTPREWECLRLTAQGYREAEAAKLLGVSPTTIRFHLDNATRKFGASTRTQAVAMAAQLGILGPIGD